jgi:hypothetical protein
MTFSQFLSQSEGAVPRFIEEANGHELWPAESTCLEDFEGFLRAHAAEPDEAVEELRAVWREFALHPANRGGCLRFDLALASWRDYAAQRRRCVRDRELCSVVEDLFEVALEESDFSDLAAADCPATSCDPDDERGSALEPSPAPN